MTDTDIYLEELKNLEAQVGDKAKLFLNEAVKKFVLNCMKRKEAGQHETIVSTRTLDENGKDVYCIGCGMDEQDGTYKYNRTVANGDEWYCTNCKDYHLH